MPEVSRFYGIIIRFYYRDHPPTHFHAIYGEHEALIEIESQQEQLTCPFCLRQTKIGLGFAGGWPRCRNVSGQRLAR